MNPSNVIARAWNWLPNGLKKFVGYGLSAGIAMVMLVWAILAFPLLRDYVKDRLGIRQDVEEVKAGLQERTDEQLNEAIAFTSHTVVRSALDSLQHANDSLFATLSRDLIEPGIAKLNHVEQQVKVLNRMLGVNNDLVRQQATAQEETNSRIGTLQQHLNGTSSEETLREILRAVRELREEQDAINQRLNKTTKQKF